MRKNNFKIITFMNIYFVILIIIIYVSFKKLFCRNNFKNRLESILILILYNLKKCVLYYIEKITYNLN